MEGILIALAVFLLAMDQQILTRTLHRPLIACTIFGMLLSNTAIGMAASIAAACLSHLVRKAADLQEQSDFTV